MPFTLAGQDHCAACTQCDKGFQPFEECTTTANAKCTECPAGKFKASRGSEACVACQVGKNFQSEPGLSG